MPSNISVQSLAGPRKERTYNPSQEAEVAAAFRDEVYCSGALGLSEEHRAQLLEIRDRP